MFFFLYNICSAFLVLPVLLFNVIRAWQRGWPLATAERFGVVPRHKLAAIAGRPVIWVHTVSVGEAIAARPLLKALRKRYPDHALVVSATTETGLKTATDFVEVDQCLYFPFDFLPSVRLILALVKPRIIIIMETELWPNFCREAARRHIPLLLANGRISDRSFPRYLKFSWFFRPALRCFTDIFMQSELGKERIIAIGAQPDNVHVAGNLKNDIPTRQIDQSDRHKLRQRYGLPDECLIITAGSTRDGEEPHIITAYRELAAEMGNLLLVLVPRHTERCAELATLLHNAGLRFCKRSNIIASTILQPGEVLLVDTVGELLDLYALADCAFVGGSLVPVGGHNLLEPASVGVPMVFGPYMANFPEITELIRTYGAGIQITAPDELTPTLRTLLTSVELRRVLGMNGLKVLRDNGGAVERHMKIVTTRL
jgi:3-deoxy-D-manno-octulosonic-acid transferase